MSHMCEHHARACAFRWVHLSTDAWSLRYLSSTRTNSTKLCQKCLNSRLHTDRSICPEYSTNTFLFPLVPSRQRKQEPTTKLYEYKKHVAEERCCKHDFLHCALLNLLRIIGKLDIQISHLHIDTLTFSLFCEFPNEGNLPFCNILLV